MEHSRRLRSAGQASHMLKLSKLHIDTTPRQTIDYIRVSAKRFAREHGKPVIFIDYLGLVRDERKIKQERGSQRSITRDKTACERTGVLSFCFAR